MQLYSKAAMIKGNAYYDFSPKGIAATTFINSLVIWPKDRYHGMGTYDDFNPLKYIQTEKDNFQDSLLQYYRMYLQGKKFWKGCSYKIERDGNVIRTKTINMPINFSEAIKPNISLSEYDLSRGGNIIKDQFYCPYTGQKIVTTWTYQKVDNVWLPKTFSTVNQTGLNGAQVSGIPKKKMTMSIRFFDHSLNKPIDPNEFTIEKLGIKPGTQITDRISGTSYEYQ